MPIAIKEGTKVKQKGSKTQRRLIVRGREKKIRVKRKEL
jgi:hypothetical protein